MRSEHAVLFYIHKNLLKSLKRSVFAESHCQQQAAVGISYSCLWYRRRGTENSHFRVDIVELT